MIWRPVEMVSEGLVACQQAKVWWGAGKSYRRWHWICPVTELLSAAQRSPLTVGLQAFEMRLRQCDAWTRGDEERGIL